MTRLPRSTDDLRGLRAARWIRESTARQADNFGPDAQRRRQDGAIAAHGLWDTGIAWSVSHSGRTIAVTPAWSEMLAAAGDSFDVLLVGYVSRLARDLETAVTVRRQLHDRGATVLFCDEGVLSSDEDQWERWARESVEAEAYSRKLAKRVTEAYAAKFEVRRDPGGNAPLGFRRASGFLEVDPERSGIVRGIFERYASGTVSLVDLEAETGIDREALKVMIRNPVYNGWVRRHRRQSDEQLLPAAWRDAPPIDDELWARVQDVRHVRYTGGGHPTPRHVHMLAGRLFCPCGDRVRAEGHKGGRRYRHYRPCSMWSRSTVVARHFEDPISAQVAGMRVGAAQLVSLRLLAASPAPTPDSTSLRRRQLERELEDLARRHARRSIDTPAYLAEHGRLTQLLDAVGQGTGPLSEGIDPDRAIAWLRDIRATWSATDDVGRRGIAAALYDRVTVTSEGIVEVQPTPDAIRHGVMLAMSEVVRARPEGIGQRGTTLRIPIVGQREALRQLRVLRSA